MDKFKELRLILAGRVSFTDGAYVAEPALLRGQLVGMFGGSDRARIMGVRSAARIYPMKDPEAGYRTAQTIFDQIGRRVLLASEPEMKACFVRNYLGNPAVLTVEKKEQGLYLAAFTARTALSALHLRYAFRAFEKRLPAELQTGAATAAEGPKREKARREKPKRKDRKSEKARRKAEKLEKRAAQASARAQAARAAQTKDEDTGE